MPRRGLLLPSLEWLQRINSRTIVISTVLLGVGVVSGGILIRLSGEAFIPWSDPVVVTTIVLFIWMLGSSIIATFYHPAREGRKVAYLTVVNFVFLAVGLVLVFLVDTEHGGRRVSKENCPGGAPYFSQGRNPWRENDSMFFSSNITSGEAARDVAGEVSFCHHVPGAAPLAKLLSPYGAILNNAGASPAANNFL